MNTSDASQERSDDSGWTTVETVVRRQIAVEVRSKENYVAGHPPLYSLRVGRARIAPDGTVWISPHMNIYDLHVAGELIEELGRKYRDVRTAQSSRAAVEQRRPARATTMQLTRDGALAPVRPQGRATSRSRYYSEDDDGENS